MMATQIGLIGAGRWGRRYIATLDGMSGVELKHLASNHLHSCDLVGTDCRVSRNWQEVARDQDMDGIIIATPPATHCEMALAAIHAGTPVLVEKPLTLDLSEAVAVTDAARTRGIFAMVGHTHLFSPAFRQLKHLGQSLGALRRIRSSGGNWGPFRSDTPMMWDWGPHDIAMCLDLVGRLPDRVEASRVKTEGEGETVAISLRFDHEVHANIHVSNIEPYKTRVFEATYELGTLLYDDLCAEKLVLHKGTTGTSESIPIAPVLPLTKMIEEFCQAIVERKISSPGLQLGLQVIEILTTCQAQLDGSER